jgi:hypothetical protein
MQEPVMGMKDEAGIALKPGETASVEINKTPADDKMAINITIAAKDDVKKEKEKKPLRGLQAFRNA